MDQPEEKTQEGALNEQLHEEDNVSIQEDMSASPDPDPNRPRFGEMIGDDDDEGSEGGGESELDSDTDFDTEKI